jgi:hypothetical protein
MVLMRTAVRLFDGWRNASHVIFEPVRLAVPPWAEFCHKKKIDLKSKAFIFLA